LIYLAEACLVVRQITAFGARHTHAHFGTNAAEVAMLTTALGGPPYSFTVHGPEEFDKPEFLGLQEKILRAAFVVAISSFGRSQLFRWMQHRAWPKVHVVHCGMEPEFYAGNSEPIPNAPRVVCVGRLCEQKGQMLLLEAVGRLRDQGVEIELVLAGDGPMRSELACFIQRNNLQTAVRITGWISSSEVRAEIIAARALVLPSFAEGLPVVIMEAMALHRPVLTTYVAGIPELIQPGKSGWLIPAGDLVELSACLKEFLSVPAVELKAITDEAYERVKERHSAKTEAAKLAKLFRGSRAG
jgi:glycosyltransferase involved in cell wall biosynthesis